jgi:hypothetical protein
VAESRPYQLEPEGRAFSQWRPAFSLGFNGVARKRRNPFWNPDKHNYAQLKI